MWPYHAVLIGIHGIARWNEGDPLPAGLIDACETCHVVRMPPRFAYGILFGKWKLRDAIAGEHNVYTEPTGAPFSNNERSAHL